MQGSAIAANSMQGSAIAPNSMQGVGVASGCLALQQHEVGTGGDHGTETEK